MKVRDLAKAIGDFELNSIVKLFHFLFISIKVVIFYISKAYNRLFIFPVLYCLAHIGYMLYKGDNGMELFLGWTSGSMEDLVLSLLGFILVFIVTKYYTIKVRLTA